MLTRWSRLGNPDSTPSSTVLDDGCGLGTVTAEVKKSLPDVPVLAIDSSAGMLEVVNRKAKKHGWKNVETKLLDGGDLNGTSILHDPLSTSTAPRPTDHPTQCMAHLYSKQITLASLVSIKLNANH